MNTKYIFFDIDGTLMDGKGYVYTSTSTSLRKLQENGHKLFVATGRCLAEVPKKILDIGFQGMILGNGSYIQYNNTLVFHQLMDKDNVIALGRKLEEHNAAVFFSAKDFCYIRKSTGEHFTKMIQDNPKALGFWNEFLEVTKIFTSLEELKDKNIEKVNYHGFQGSVEELRRDFGDYFHFIPSSAPSSSVIGSGEVSNNGINKAEGVKTLLKFLGKEDEPYIAFGDGYNDVEMLQSAHIGIAMGNGVEILKENADIVTASVSDDGIYKALTQLELL